MQDTRIPSLPLIAWNSASRQSREMEEEGGACSVGTAVTFITTSILISCPTANNPRAKPRGLTEIPASRRYCHSGTEPAAEVETTAGVFPGSGGTDVITGVALDFFKEFFKIVWPSHCDPGFLHHRNDDMDPGGALREYAEVVG
ncbi:hypothetical protein AUP68_05367 [Ilyonectria robusta]